MSETAECLEITRETARKVDVVIETYEKKSRECNSKDNIIKSQSVTIRTLAIILGVCFLFFMYGYFYAPYLAGDINSENSGGGNSVVAIG